MCMGRGGSVHYFAKFSLFLKRSLVFNVNEYILLITNKVMNTYQNKGVFYVI